MNNNLPMAVPYVVSGYCGVYPGVTTRPEQRKKEHMVALQNGRHFNVDLQQAANEHGVLSFVYLTLTPVPFAQAAKAEQKILDDMTKAGFVVFNKYRAPSRPHPVGYKLSERTKRKQSRAKRGNQNASKQMEFVAPDGRLVRTSCLSDLCDKYGLNISAMSRLFHQKQNEHRGWTCKKGGMENV